MNWISVKSELWPCMPPLLLYPLLHLKTEYLFTTVDRLAKKINNNMCRSVGREDEPNVVLIQSYTRIYSYIMQFYTHNHGLNHKSPALHKIYSTYNFVLYNRIVCTPSVNITFVVFASAGVCTDIADFRTSR